MMPMMSREERRGHYWDWMLVGEKNPLERRGSWMESRQEGKDCRGE